MTKSNRRRIRESQRPANAPESSRIILVGFFGMILFIIIAGVWTLWQSPCSIIGVRVRNTGCVARYRNSQASVGFVENGEQIVFSTENYVLIEDISEIREEEARTILPLEHPLGTTIEKFLISADQSTVVSTIINEDSERRSLFVWNINDREQVWQSGLSEEQLLALSPDGSQVVLSDGDVRVVWNVPGGEKQFELDAVGAWYTPDGETLAFTQGKSLLLFNPDSFEQTDELAFEAENDLACPVFSPDGRYVAFGDIGALRVLDVETLEEVFTLPQSSQLHFCAYAFSAESDKLIVALFTPGRSDAAVTIYDIASGSAERTVNTQYTFPLEVALSTNEDLLAIGGVGTSYLLDLQAIPTE